MLEDDWLLSPDELEMNSCSGRSQSKDVEELEICCCSLTLNPSRFSTTEVSAVKSSM